jgi:ABC-type glycerol-3-phosphate transport system permease component
LIITVAPFLWTIANSFKENQVIFSQAKDFSFSTFLPGTTFSSYIEIFEQGFGRAILNTAFVATVSVLLGILFNSMAGFAFAVFDFRGKNILFAIVLLTFAVPGDAIAIPLFMMIRSLGWFDTYTALIVPAIANGLIIFLYRQFFAGVPRALYEAAKVDGLSWWRIYLKIFMPLAKPVTIGAGLLLFVGQWESYLWPLIATPSPDMQMIQVALSRFSTEFTSVWNQQFAASTIAGLLPLIFIYRYQKQFISALTGVDLK